MKLHGIIRDIQADGYERLILVDVNGQLFWFAYTQANEYLECGERSLLKSVGDLVLFDVRLELASSAVVAREGAGASIKQDIPRSPHAVVVGDVLAKMAVDSYALLVAEGMQLNVELEIEVDLKIGSRVCVCGELVAEDC